MNRFSFCNCGARQGMLDRCTASLCPGYLNKVLNCPAVFCMHGNKGSVVPGANHDLQECGVIHHKSAGIRCEEFETGDPLSNQVIEFFNLVACNIDNDHVQTVIDC